jgi:ABC-type antimicrobial peptide transport system permease subunit
MFFGLLALLIAAVGLTGLMSYSVTRRRAEIGIRAALGATRGSLVALVMREIISILAVAVVVGSLAGVAASRLIAPMLYEVTPSDPVILGMAVMTLTIVALLAGYIPARRAATIDPVECLRSQ